MIDGLGMTRRTLLRGAGLRGAGMMLGAGAMAPIEAAGPGPVRASSSGSGEMIRLCFNENPYGPSRAAIAAVQRELSRANRYADERTARAFAEQIAAYERVSVEQVVLGEILELLGLYLGSKGGPGGEFVYSIPGYMALVDAAARVGGVGVGVPLDARGENDLGALRAKINSRTRAVYLVNPHNPTGTVNENAAWKAFLREMSARTVVIVDEAYLEYMANFAQRSAVSLVREGADVMVFRTFEKIHGLAGLPIGYVLAPRALAEALRTEGAGNAESLGRLNLAAAAAALADTAQVERTRVAVARERERWMAVLVQLGLKHTAAEANFVFFDTERPQAELAGEMRAAKIDIGRAHPPYSTWARVSIGLPEENRRAQEELRRFVGRPGG